MKSLYLIINLISISYPLLKSWDKRINFYTKWPALFKAIGMIMMIMIPWDIAFTKLKVWGFNPTYNLGVELFTLPVEEWMFFIFIPFACVFIYEVVIYFDSKNTFLKYGKTVNAINLMLSIYFLYLGFGQVYSTVALTVLIIVLSYHQFAATNYYLGRFYLSFIFMLIPFFAINGILTGAFINEEVVWYNMTETFGVRLFTIPLEDVFYCLFMMLFTISWYERFKRN